MVQDLEFKVQQAKNNTSDAVAHVCTAAEEAKTSWLKRRAHHPALEARAAIKP